MQQTASLSKTTPEVLVLGQITEEKGMIEGMKNFPVLENFSFQEKVTLEATGDPRVWLIATFFNTHLTNAEIQLRGCQQSYKSVCDSKNGNHFPDPNQSEGGVIAEAVDRNASLLDHSNNRIYHLTMGKERFMKELGKYGNCRECGEPIFLKRLELCPHSGLCVPCKGPNGK